MRGLSLWGCRGWDVVESDEICSWWEQCSVVPSLQGMCAGMVQGCGAAGLCVAMLWAYGDVRGPSVGLQRCAWPRCGVTGLQGCACHQFRVTGLLRCAW